MSTSNVLPKTLYIVSTPIGNLADISQRAIDTLRDVDVIACEDTRHTQKLLTHLAIQNRTISLHDHNERQRQQYIVELLSQGLAVALVSDAGTPLISDPGYHLVRYCKAEGFNVVPVPGACAAIAALSVAGLPTDKFVFEGFLPSKSGARIKALEQVKYEPRTIVFYDAPRRAIDTLTDVVATLGEERYVVIARELTKTFETIVADTAENLRHWLAQDPNQLKGEMVIIIEGYQHDERDITPQITETLKLLLHELPPKKACAIAAEIYQVKKNVLYQYALTLK